MNTAEYMIDVGRKARRASRHISAASTHTKNTALIAIADSISSNSEQILSLNQEDVGEATSKDLDLALIDRLTLTKKSVANMAEGLRQIAQLHDPVGEIQNLRTQPSGITVGTMRVPIGVIGIIYESRPNVTADAAALCLKSGNAVVLRGGSESIKSNRIIGKCIAEGLALAGIDPAVVQVVETTDREAVGKLITMNDWIDVIVPRGGKGLIERISNVPRFLSSSI